jgi:hypothetical protein
MIWNYFNDLFYSKILFLSNTDFTRRKIESCSQMSLVTIWNKKIKTFLLLSYLGNLTKNGKFICTTRIDKKQQTVFLGERWGNCKIKILHNLNAKSIYVYSTAIPIAEQLYFGLYCSDCACQTEQNEIVQLKSTTKLLKNLYQV